jgi:hypothetical protein
VGQSKDGGVLFLWGSRSHEQQAWGSREQRALDAFYASCARLRSFSRVIREKEFSAF